MTQKEAVINYINEHGSITTKEANKIGITRISAVIFKIKEDGYIVESEWKKVKSRYAHNCTYVKEYRIKGRVAR